MAKLPRVFVLVSAVVLIPYPLLPYPLLLAQTRAQTPAPAADGATAATPAPSSQAPDEMTKKITDLVLAGKYAEAQELTEGLLVAYPGDQRLIKAKALIDSRLAPGNSASAALVGSQPAQPAANANAAQLTGMDKVDYNALIVLARQAQQTTDLDEQKKMLKQFMDQSGVFLQKHPDQLLIWQLRVASSISLNEPMEGYEAGQKLLGAASNSDPTLQQLLVQLKNKGWLDKQNVEKQANYAWILGTWKDHAFRTIRGHDDLPRDSIVEFTKSDSLIEGFLILPGGGMESTPWFRGTIADSGEVTWDPGSGTISGGLVRVNQRHLKPVGVQIGSDKRTMKLVYSGELTNGGYGFFECEYTHVFTKR